MRISRQVFTSLPSWMLPWLSSPIVWDDACLLSCAEADDITHAVRASDGRVYDVEALHNFFASCGSTARVLPHEMIDYVVTIPWIHFMAEKLWKRVFCRACQISLQSKELHQGRYAPCAQTASQSSSPRISPTKSMFLRVVETNTRRIQVDSEFFGKRGIKRSACSAFEETASSPSWKKNKHTKTRSDVERS